MKNDDDKELKKKIYTNFSRHLQQNSTCVNERFKLQTICNYYVKETKTNCVNK